ncbi:hypothetical protein Kisp02_32410 [Kineosporia sp. NBRC 101731]|nr:hypothetical protein Kisp02_32410 [Kineosporia sp. NBRC 101731]
MPAETPVGVNSRISAHTFDSVVQKDLVDAWSETAIDREVLQRIVLGRLRIEALLSECLVLTDAQVFDGAIIKQLATGRLITSLSRGGDSGISVPIEIRGRAATLEQCLPQIYMDKKRPRPFLPSIVSNGYEVRESLRNRRSLPRKSGIAGCLRLLKDAGVDSAELEEIEAGWRYLLQLEQEHRIQYRPWTTPMTGHLPLAESYWPRSDLEHQLMTQQGHEAFREVLDLGTDRSRVLQFVRAEALAQRTMSVDDRSPAEVDLDIIMHWFNERYLRALAFQQDANYRGSSAIPGKDTSFHLLEQLESRNVRVIEIDVPSGLLTHVGNMGTLYWETCQQAMMPRLREWWLNGDIDQLRRVFDYLHDDFSKNSPEGEKLSRTAKMFGSLSVGRLTLNASIAVGGAALGEVMQGAAVAVFLMISESMVESLAGPTPKRAGVEVTSYLNEPPA